MVLTTNRGQESYATAHAISLPDHDGDLIFPCPFGHLDTCTDAPSSVVILSFTKGSPHWPQVISADIPHVGHS